MSKYQKIGKNDGWKDPLFSPNTSILGELSVIIKKTTKTMFVFILNLSSDSFFIAWNEVYEQKVKNIQKVVSIFRTYGII